MDPKELRFATTHEWAGWEGDLVVVGISQYAVEQLTDIVYVDLPEVGDQTIAGESFGEIESVKAVSDLYAPIDGEVAAVNEKVVEDPAVVTSDPYGTGWLIKIKPEAGKTLDHLLTFEQYQKQISEENPD